MIGDHCDNARCERCGARRVAALIASFDLLFKGALAKLDAPSSERGAQGFVLLHKANARLSGVYEVLHDVGQFRGCE